MSAISCRSGLSRSLAFPIVKNQHFKHYAPSTLVRSSSSSSTSIPLSSPEEIERQWAEKLTDGKAAMIQLGYHGPSLWTQVICWGDHDQVSGHMYKGTRFSEREREKEHSSHIQKTNAPFFSIQVSTCQQCPLSSICREC